MSHNFGTEALSIWIDGKAVQNSRNSRFGTLEQQQQMEKW
jgi:hypothetical protein